MLAVKVFTATKARDRSNLGDEVTEWMEARNIEPIDYQVRQSSDSAYHCLTIVITYDDRGSYP